MNHEITIESGNTLRLLTAGKYCDRDIIITATGGTPAFSATINVTYPSGATVKCTKGSTTLTAPDTSGTWAISIPEAGTWTVTATKGSSSKSQSVNITTQGQVASVTFAFETILFDSSTTSGWTKTGHAGHSARITGGKITLTGDTTLDSGALYNIGVYYYRTLVQCTSGQVLKASVTSVGASYGRFGTEAKAKLIVTTAPDKVDGSTIYDQSSIDDCPHFVAVANISGTGVTSLSLPSGSYYLGLAYTNWVQLSADKVWIE